MTTTRHDILAADLRVDTRQFSRGLRKGERSIKGLERTSRRSAGRIRTAFSRLGIGDLTRKFSGLGRTIMGLAGAYGFSSLIRKTMEFEDTLADLAIRGNKSNEWLAQTRDQILDVSRATGVSKEQLAGFSVQFTELTGDAQTGVDMLKTMSKVAVATGADIRSLASVYDQLSGSLNITKDEAYQTFNILRKQEKLGAVGFRGIAQGLPSLAPIAGAMFGQRGVGAARDVGALLQLSRRGTESTSEAVTAAKNFLMQVAKKAPDIEQKLGVSLYDEKGNFKTLAEISRLIGEGLKGMKAKDIGKMAEWFGVRGVKTAAVLSQAAKAGWGNTIGSRASAASLYGAGAEDVIQTDYDRRMQTRGRKYKVAMARLQATAHEELLPVLDKLIEVMPDLAKGAGWLLENMQLLGKLWIAWKAAGVLRNVISASAALSQVQGDGRMRGGTGGMGGASSAMRMAGGFNVAVTAVSLFGAVVSETMRKAHKRTMELHDLRMKALKSEMDVIRGFIDLEKKETGLKSLETWYNLGGGIENTVAGARIRDKMTEMLPGLRGAKGSYSVDINRIIKRGKKGALGYIEQLKALRENIVGAGVAEARKRNLELTPEQIAQTSYAVQTLDKIIGKIEPAVVKGLRGVAIKPNVRVNLGVTTPSNRVRENKRSAQDVWEAIKGTSMDYGAKTPTTLSEELWD